MVNFVKPNLLGTSKEFRNRFVNPITNGQCADSTAHDVKIMKRRAHILHEKLNGCVQVLRITVYTYALKTIFPHIKITQTQFSFKRKNCLGYNSTSDDGGNRGQS